MPTGADVAGTYSILSLILSLFAPSLPPSLSLFFCLSPFFFLFDQMERCSAPNLSHSGSQCSVSCDPVCYLLPLCLSFSLSLSIHKRLLSLFLSVLFPLTKTDKGLSFLLACLCSVCLYCTKLGSLSHCIPSFSLQKKVSRGPGAPVLRQGACLSSAREEEEGGKGRRAE